MSSKAILVEKEGYTLYQEVFDNTEVYLEIENPNYKLITNHYHGELEEKIVIAIPQNIWASLKETCDENR